MDGDNERKKTDGLEKGQLLLLLSDLWRLEGELN